MNIAMTFPDTVDEFMEQYKSIDTECVYSNGIEYVPIFRMKQWFEHLKVKPKTNADIIRSMTDEELAEEIVKCVLADLFRLNVIGTRPNTKEEWLEWLKEETGET